VSIAGVAFALAGLTLQVGLPVAVGAAAPVTAGATAAPTSAPSAGTATTAGAATTAPPTANISPSAVTTCTPALPSAGLVVAARTSLLLSLTAPCRQYVTLHVYTSADASIEAGAWSMPVPQSAARVRFVNLVPGTAYWYRVTWVVGPDAPVQSGPLSGPVRTTTVDPTVGPVPHPTPTCLAVIPSLTLQGKTPYSLAFSVDYVCDRSATVRVFADAAGRTEVARWTVQPTYSAIGNEHLVVTRLNADTAYWYGLSYADPDSAPVGGLQGTLTSPISTIPTTTRATPSSTACGSPQLLGTSRTTITFGGPTTCPAFTLSLFADAAGTTPVGAVTQPAGTPLGDVRFANLSPQTPYWYWISGSGVEGPITTAAADPTAGPEPSVTCPPVQPSLEFSTATDTELQLVYRWLCGRSLQVHLYTDAAGTHEFTSIPLTPARVGGGVLDVTRLPSGTAFWWNYSQNGYTSPIQGPARTTSSSTVTASSSVTTSPGPGPSSCAAAMKIVSSWDDGFVADVDVRNTGTEPITWSVAWTWTGGQSLTQAWNATVAGTPTSPVLTGAGWNRQLQAGQTATAGLLGRGPAGSVPVVTCSGV
jgi:Cellulose binding domain